MACLRTLRRIASSGMASIKPKPKSGVELRCTMVLASGGTVSKAAGRIAWSCSNEPPSASRESNFPFLVRPKRVTLRALPPPVAPLLWQATQELSLKIGPRPPSTSSDFSKSALPSAKSCNCSAVKPASGSPRSGLAGFTLGMDGRRTGRGRSAGCCDERSGLRCASSATTKEAAATRAHIPIRRVLIIGVLVWFLREPCALPVKIQ